MSYSIKGKRITLTRGDTFPCEVKAYNPDGSEYEMQAGDSMRFMLSEQAGGPTILTKQVVDGSFQLDPADTDQLDFGTYFFDVQMTFADGTVDTFIAEGQLALTDEADPKYIPPTPPTP